VEPAPRFLEVTVVTRPKGASLYVDGSYSGPDGTNLRRNWGTAITVVCRLPGYNDGEVTVHFDGKNDLILCKLNREVAEKDCVAGLKNPFANCDK
jgi:hypothetical protein